MDWAISYLSPHAAPLRFTGAEASARSIFDALESPSLFGGDPAVVVDELEKMAKQELKTFAENLPSTGILLLGARAKTALVPLVEKEGVILDLLEEKPWDREKRLLEQLHERVQNAGKRLATDAAPLLFERVGLNPALLDCEIDKLICYTGERLTIERADLFRISQESRTHSLWQTAEAIVWEGGAISSLDSGSFHALIPSLRSQLQLGLKIASLLEDGAPPEMWSSAVPKLWPKTLEKRRAQAAQLGSAYFRKGLERLFSLELLSRNGSNQLLALLDLFRAYARR